MAKKQPNKDQQEVSAVGENTLVEVTIPKEDHEKEYKKVLQQYVAFTRIPGFRKGKAPANLVEASVGADQIIERVLNSLLPVAYERAVKKAGITPLVQPQVTAKSVNPGEDWVFEAATAVAPQVTLGDYKKIIKEAVAEHAKEHKHEPAEKTDKDVKKTEEDLAHEAEHEKEHLLSVIFTKLIEKVGPKIAPTLQDFEYQRLLRNLGMELAQYKVDLDTYLKHSGKTIEDLKTEYSAQALASLQLEFTLNEITETLKPEITDADVMELLGENATKLPPHDLEHRKADAVGILKRRKTIDHILGIARAA